MWCAVLLLQADNHRIITFAGQFEPVDRACRAPLPSGKLCPRRDREKVGREQGEGGPMCDCATFTRQCPFHGAIVPRDEHGTPLHPSQQSPDSGEVHTVQKALVIG